MSESGEGPRKIKVVDRRRFDDTGDLRPDRPAPAPAPAPVEPVVVPDAPKQSPPEPEFRPASPPVQEPPAGPPEPGVGGADSTTATLPLFIDLVAGLAQQAEMLLTGAQGMPAQPAEAQRVIEYLAMLEIKTAGNLSAEEKQILTNVVFQLRTLFVQNNP